MSLWSRSPKLGSLALVALLGVAGGGCVMVDRDHDGDHHGGGWTKQPPGTLPVTPEQVVIDADAALEATPGDGIGVMVEYATGGHWHVFTTCDFNLYQTPCEFDIIAKVLDAGGAIDNAKGEELSGKDLIELSADGSVHLYTRNTEGVSGIRFDTAPGALVELNVYIDGQQDPHFVYWVGKEVLHRGAPTIPLHFMPSEPPPVEPPPEGNTPPAP